MVTLAGLACSRRSLQEDDGGGPGSIGLDAAGGATQNDGGLGGSDTPPPTIDAWSAPVDGQPTCGVSTIAGNRVPAEILLVLDSSIAGDQTGWRNLISTVVNQINANDAGFDWGLYTFPKDGPACGAATVMAAPTSGSLGQHFTSLPTSPRQASRETAPPTAAAIGAGAAYLHTVADQNPKFMMLVTDGAPTCAGAIGAPLSDDAALAQADAVAAITAARDEGFFTTSGRPVDDDGGERCRGAERARGSGALPRLGDIKFHTESTLPELFSLTTAESCIFQLGQPAAAARLVSA